MQTLQYLFLFLQQTANIWIRQQKYFQFKMTQEDPSLSQSQSFLPLDSSIDIRLPNSTLTKQKASKLPKQSSLLYEELRKIVDDDTNKKRQCIIKYLKREGQMKDTSRIISKIQKEGHAIPILQVAIALSRYDHRFLKELLDSKTIELKQAKQQQLYELNKKLKSDPILSLLSDSEQLNKLPNQQKQPSFLDFKMTSPKRKHDVIDFEKGKLKKSKVKVFGHVQYPKQLQTLKKELFSLPYINQYKKELSLKKNQRAGKFSESTEIQLTKISQLNNMDKSLGSIQKKLSKFNQRQVSLSNTLERAVKFRASKIQVSNKEIAHEKSEQLDKTNFKKPIPDNPLSNKKIFDTIVSKDKSSSSTVKNSRNHSSINPEEQDQLSQTSQQTNTRENNKSQLQYWPQYQRFSPHNKKYVFEIEKLQSKVRSITELPQIPSEETLSMYASLKSLEANDLKKLEKQSAQQQKAFSNTKYKVKFKNIKQNYSKRLKQFIKDRKVRQFQLQQLAIEQKSQLTAKVVKLNDKLLEKICLQQN